MRAPDAADVAIEIDTIRAYVALEKARQRVDPRTSPVAILVDPAHAAGECLRDALRSVELRPPTRDTALWTGWAPRADVARALRSIDPLEAMRLMQARPSDVSLWTVVHAAQTCRVLERTPRGPVARAAERQILGFIHRGCFDTSCDDAGDHEWDQRECVDDETGEWRDDTTCVRCGVTDEEYNALLAYADCARADD